MSLGKLTVLFTVSHLLYLGIVHFKAVLYLAIVVVMIIFKLCTMFSYVVAIFVLYLDHL